MAELKVQNVSNHAKLDPPFHFFIMPVAISAVVVTGYQVTQRQNLTAAWFFILALAAVLACLKLRIYALKVQDRVIRLEETLRMQRLLPESLRARVGKLTEGQFVALRFASDAELAGLVEQALNGEWNSKKIKQNIVNWRPDYFECEE